MYHNAINTHLVDTYTPPIIVISITATIHQTHLDSGVLLQILKYRTHSPPT